MDTVTWVGGLGGEPGGVMSSYTGVVTVSSGLLGEGGAGNEGGEHTESISLRYSSNGGKVGGGSHRSVLTFPYHEKS